MTSILIPIAPNIFNVIRYIAIYLLTDNVLEWLRGKLKRSYAVNRLSRGQAVDADIIRNQGHRKRVNSLLLRRSVPPQARDRNIYRHVGMDWVTALIIQLVPVLTWGFLLALELGVDSTVSCPNKLVKIRSAIDNRGVVPASLQCSDIMDVKLEKNGGLSQIEVSAGRVFEHDRGAYCSCDPGVRSNCMEAERPAPKVTTYWETISGRSSRGKVLEKISKNFLMPSSSAMLLEATPRNLSFPGDYVGKIECEEISSKSKPDLRALFCAVTKKNRHQGVADFAGIVHLNNSRNKLFLYKDADQAPNDKFSTRKDRSAETFNRFIRKGALLYYVRGESLREGNLELDMKTLLSLGHTYNMANAEEYQDIELSRDVVKIMAVMIRPVKAQKGYLYEKCNTIVTEVNVIGIASAIVIAVVFSVIFTVIIVLNKEGFWELFTKARRLEDSDWMCNSLLSSKFGSGNSLEGRHVHSYAVVEWVDDSLEIVFKEAPSLSEAVSRRQLQNLC